MFPPELERAAYRECNGEFGWTRSQAMAAVKVLVAHSFAILGGELWWVREGVPGWRGSIPQRQGPPAVYAWETDRLPGEPWSTFVERSVADTLAALSRWPQPDDLPSDLPGRILYNLTWASEVEFAQLRRKPV